MSFLVHPYPANTTTTAATPGAFAPRPRGDLAPVAGLMVAMTAAALLWMLPLATWLVMR